MTFLRALACAEIDNLESERDRELSHVLAGLLLVDTYRWPMTAHGCP